MNKDDLITFKNKVDFPYDQKNKGSHLNLDINEQHYNLKVRYKIKSDIALYFRLEDLKEKANYLKGKKRSPIRDNDLTIIDDVIYQIEIKFSKSTGSQHQLRSQFAGGKFWLNHLLTAVYYNHDSVNFKRDVYNVELVNLSRKNLIRSNGNCSIYKKSDSQSNGFSTVIIDNPNLPIDLTYVLRNISKSTAKNDYIDTNSL